MLTGERHGDVPLDTPKEKTAFFENKEKIIY